MEVVNAIGRRKAAVARVFVSEGTGKITINKRELEKYFPSSILQFIVKQPLAKLNVAEQYDIKINLDGGGFKGQSEAARLAISRALIKINPEVVNAIGRRKAAVARVFVSEGTGKITINKRELEKYFPSSILQFIVKQPLAKLNVAEQYDIKINLDGGGFKGQSEAARLAISRALIKINPEDKAVLRAEGFVTRDPRAVERKKPGRPKARKRFQFSKR